ncbi:hypothetical protein M0R45_028111 [Rubus argutus]|uniref:Uncharacterized protein n=1 Tax=Rubus argutus TaxID=59490 RepID=A0AAW1W3N9_RUBAR
MLMKRQRERGLKDVQGCHDVKATIDAPNLYRFSFEGYVKSKFSFKASELRATSITLLDKWDGKSSTFNNEELKDFLEAFGSCTDMVLNEYDFNDLIFAEDLRKNSKMLPILPNLKDVELIMKNPPTEGRDHQDLMQSLYWMAPSLQDITKR